MNRSPGIDQRLINIFGCKRHQRRHDFAQIDQNGIQNVKGLPVTGPETVAGTANIPVVENFHKIGNFIAGMGNIISV